MSRRRAPGRALLRHSVDATLAATRLYSSLPVVGKHLEPLGALTTLALWGGHYAPDIVRNTVRGHRGTPDAVPDAVVGSGLPVAAMAPEAAIVDQAAITGGASRVPPYVRFRAQRRKSLFRSSVRYGNHPAQLLDVWRRRDLPSGPAPVLLFVPGGAWVRGSRILQGHTMMAHLVERGWVCLTMDYRVSPLHRWPRHVRDVNAAIAWARANVDQFGGDRDFVTVAGCSAGGHLASLTGLTPGDPVFRGSLAADADTSVDAVVSIYGRYDWEDRSTPTRRNFQSFLERVVVGRKQSRHPEVFRDASPLARLHADAPPFLLIHGEHDTIIPVGEAREFHDALRRTSRETVRYVEVPRAGHAFDLVSTSLAQRCAVEVGDFLEGVRARRVRRDAVAG